MRLHLFTHNLMPKVHWTFLQPFSQLRCFAKLAKWTVGHVHAPEDYLNDVERWLLDKEKEKQETTFVKDSLSQEDGHQELHDVRNKIAELQGRVGELGREMAKLATATSTLHLAQSCRWLP